ncbi:MAG: hypothetical protein H0X27_09580 [Caulobacteraceae bacterium]|nr:hypothetical protein [Caulobacteraceae bacterium]
MAVVRWKSGVGGAWETGSNWRGGVAPGAGDDVFIRRAGLYTVTIGAPEAVGSLTLNRATATVVNDAALTIGTTLSIDAGTFQLDSGGKIIGGTLSAAGGVFRWNGGVLSGVTYDGTLDLSADFARLTLTDGFTVHGANGTAAGAIDLTGAGAVLKVAGGETLDHATLSIGNASYSVLSLYDPPGATPVLTLGHDFEVIQAGRFAQIDDLGFADEGVVNKGAITAAVSGGNFIVAVRNFTNGGTISVGGGDTLTLQPAAFTNTTGGVITVTGAGTIAHLGVAADFWSNAGSIAFGAGATGYIQESSNNAWTNTGTISLASGATLHLGGHFTTAEFKSIANGGGTILIDGAMNNTLATLKVGPGTGDPVVGLQARASIVGGVVVDKGAGLGFHGGTLSGVTYQGTLDLSAPGSILFVAGGLKATGVDGAGPGTIELTGAGSALEVTGGETLDNATLDIGSDGLGGASLHLYNPSGATPVLTLGTRFNVIQVGGHAQINGYLDSPSETIINNGAITAAVAGGQLIVNPYGFTNNGSITVGAGETLLLQSTRFTNLSGGTLTGGRYEVDAGSMLELMRDATIAADNARIVLSGAGSSIQSFDTMTSQEIPIEATLTAIGPAGSLQLLGGRNWASGQAISNAGWLELGGGTFAPAGLINTGSIHGYGVVAAGIADEGLIEASGGLLDLTLAVTGGGVLAADADATLEVDRSASASLTMRFDGPGATLALGAAARFKATIEGFAPGGAIDLLGKTATSATLGAGDTLVISNGAHVIATLQLAGDHSGEAFTVAADGHGGTIIGVEAPEPGAPGGRPCPPRDSGLQQRFTGAMAGLGPAGAGWADATSEGSRHASPFSLMASRGTHLV